jgi:CIC family chloride channel protein
MSLGGYLKALLPSLGLRSLGRWVVYGVVIGVISGLGAGLFYVALDGVRYVVMEVLAGARLTHPHGEQLIVSEGEHVFRPWLFFLLPTIGGLLAGLVVSRFAPEAAGVGTEALVDAFHTKRGHIRSRVPLVKAIGTIFTLGFGGASGREGPIAQIGGGFGSWLARRLGLKARERRILLLAGAAGGFGAIFRAPLGGAVTAVEVLYREDLETDALVPCVISSVTAYAIFTGIFGFEAIFQLPTDLSFIRPHELLFYLVLGFLCVPVGAVTVKVFWGIQALFQKLRRLPAWIVPALGGLLLGGLQLALMASGALEEGTAGVYGAGWGQIQQSLRGELVIGTMLVLLVGKIVAMGLTLGSGGSGGVFGPTLFIGAMLGGVFGLASREVFGAAAPAPEAVIIVAMCAFFAGVANAPLGALLMTLEISRSYGLVAPLMLVSVLAVLFTSRWSIFRNQRRNKFHSPAHQGDLNVNVLEGLCVREVMRPPELVASIPSNADFPEIRRHISRSDETWFPVVHHEDGRLVGILSLGDARPVLFEQDLDHLLLAEDVMGPSVQIEPEVDLYAGLLKILDSGYGEIPVTDPETGKIVGLLRHGDLLRAYHLEMGRGDDEEEGEGETP